jgi:serine/threonine-protein kinase RsbW
MSTLDAERLVLHNELAELDRLAGWIEGWTQEGVSPDLSLAMQLCLEEAVANIIMHGSANDDRPEITIEMERNGGTLVARIEDTGREFDPTQVPAPLLANSLDDAKAGGFGIHLMRSFASGMHYERRENDSNRLTMWFFEWQEG